MDLKEAQEQLTASLLEHADGQLADSSATTEAQSSTGAPDEDSVSIDLNDEDQQGGYGASADGRKHDQDRGRHESGALRGGEHPQDPRSHRPTLQGGDNSDVDRLKLVAR